MMKLLNRTFFTRKATVLKCGNPFSWYKNRIGETFNVEKSGGEYITTEKINNHNRGYLERSDVKISFSFFS